MTIPISVGWFIVIVAVTAVGSCVFATWASLHLERKEIAKEELRIAVSKGILKHRMEIHDNRHRMLCLREEASTEEEKRLGSMAAREEAVRKHEHDLCQAAHDLDTQVRLISREVSDDTVVLIPQWENDQ